ncbi:hypothetical protein [Cellulomonas sp. URHE0023]|uniref:hypothetical protein n=1 Tax=Cellulomonas sp. URHE0023 TaxID=1380354 RepID=UPI00048301DA|nr:hypothetical protein [Cellulomonas sp. URHE0023]
MTAGGDQQPMLGPEEESSDLPVDSRLWIVFWCLPFIWLALKFWSVPVAEPPTVGAFVVDRMLEIGTALSFAVVLAILLPPVVLDLARSYRLPYADRLPARLPQGVRTSALWVRLSAIGICVVGLALSTAVLPSALRPPLDPWPYTLAVVVFFTSVGMWIWLWSGIEKRDRKAARQVVGFGGVVALGVPIVLQLMSASVTSSLNQSTNIHLELGAVSRELSPDGTAFEVRVESKATSVGEGEPVVLAYDVVVCSWPLDAEVEYRIRMLAARANCTIWRPSGPGGPGGWFGGSVPWVDSRVFSVPVERPRLVLVAEIEYGRGDRTRLSNDLAIPQTCVVTYVEGGVGEEVEGRLFRIADEAKFRGTATESRYLWMPESAFDDSEPEFWGSSVLGDTHEPPVYAITGDGDHCTALLDGATGPMHLTSTPAVWEDVLVTQP